jgi:hypothetical protein
MEEIIKTISNNKQELAKFIANAKPGQFTNATKDIVQSVDRLMSTPDYNTIPIDKREQLQRIKLLHPFFEKAETNAYIKPEVLTKVNQLIKEADALPKIEVKAAAPVSNKDLTKDLDQKINATQQQISKAPETATSYRDGLYHHLAELEAKKETVTNPSANVSSLTEKKYAALRYEELGKRIDKYMNELSLGVARKLTPKEKEKYSEINNTIGKLKAQREEYKKKM